jgi:hypothetical protein
MSCTSTGMLWQKKIYELPAENLTYRFSLPVLEKFNITVRIRPDAEYR